METRRDPRQSRLGLSTLMYCDGSTMSSFHSPHKKEPGQILQSFELSHLKDTAQNSFLSESLAQKNRPLHRSLIVRGNLHKAQFPIELPSCAHGGQRIEHQLHIAKVSSSLHDGRD